MNAWIIGAARSVLSARFPVSWAVPAWPNWLGFIVAGVFASAWYYDDDIIVRLLTWELIDESSTRTLPRTIRYLSMAGVLAGLIGSLRVVLWPPRRFVQFQAVRNTAAVVWDFFSPLLVPLSDVARAGGRTLGRGIVEFGKALAQDFRRFGRGSQAGIIRVRIVTSGVSRYLAKGAGAFAVIVGAVIGRVWFAVAAVSRYFGRAIALVLAFVGHGLRIVLSAVGAGLAFTYAGFMWTTGRAGRVLALVLAGLFAGVVAILVVVGFALWVLIKFVGNVAYLISRATLRGTRAIGVRTYSVLLTVADTATVALGAALRWIGVGLATIYRVSAIPITAAAGILGLAARAAGHAISLLAATAFAGLIAIVAFAGLVIGVAFDYLSRGFMVFAQVMLLGLGVLVSAIATAFGFLSRGATATVHLIRLTALWFFAGLAGIWVYGASLVAAAVRYLAIGFLASVRLAGDGLRAMWNWITELARFAWRIVSMVIGYLRRGFWVTTDVVGSGLEFAWSGFMAAIGFALLSISLGIEALRRTGLVVALLLLLVIGALVLAVTAASVAVWRGVSATLSAIAFVAALIGSGIVAVLQLLWLGIATGFGFAWLGFVASSRAVGIVLATAWSGVVAVLQLLWTGIATTSRYAWLGFVASSRAVGIVLAIAWSGVVAVLRLLWLGIATGFGFAWLGFVASSRAVGIVLAIAWSGVVAVLQLLWTGIATTSGYAWLGFVTSARAVGFVLAGGWSGVVAVLQLLWTGIATTSRYAWLGFVISASAVGFVIARSASAIGHGLMFVWPGVSTGFGYVWRAGTIAALTLGRAVAAVVSVLYAYVSQGFLIALAGLDTGVLYTWAVIASGSSFFWSIIAMAFGYLAMGLAAVGGIIRTGLISAISVLGVALRQFAATLSAGYDQLRRGVVAIVRPVAAIVSRGGVVTMKRTQSGVVGLLALLVTGASVVFRTLSSMGVEAWFLATGGTGYLWAGAAATGSYASAGSATIGRPLASGGATSVGVLGRIVTPVFRTAGMMIGYLGTGASAAFRLVPKPGLVVPVVGVMALAWVGYTAWNMINEDALDDTLVVSHWTTGHLTRDGLLNEMAAAFNSQGHVTSSGEPFIIRVYDAPSELQGEYLTELLINGTRRDLNAETNGYVVADIPDPTIVTPSSAHWLVSTNYEIGQAGIAPVVDLEAAKSIVRPVIGIVTYEVMARCLGWPNIPIGFEEIIALRDDPLGWGGYTCANGTRPDAEWGQRPLLAFTDPTTSSTGRSLHLALYAFAAGKSPGELNVADVTDSDVVGYVKDFQSLIDHYLIGTTVLNTKIYQGKEYGHFFVMPEDNLIHLYEGTESSFFNGVKATAPPIEESMVMIYPKEGSMPRNNCACIVDADWVTPDHVEASQQWIDFIRLDPQQKAFMAAGFRPGTDIGLNFPGSKITRDFGLDPTEPKVVVNPSLTLPEVAAAIDETWDDVKRPGIVTFVADTSGSMLVSGKLGEAKDGMKRAFTAMAPNNRVGLVSFNDDVSTDVEIALLSENSNALRVAVQDLKAIGETALYDAIKRGVEMTDSVDGDESAIRAVVVLTDGRANVGDTGLDDLIYMSDPAEKLISGFSGFDGDTPPPWTDGLAAITGIGLAIDTQHPIQIFFIGIGADADLEIGRMLAEATGGEFQKSSEEDLAETLEEFSAYF